MLFQTQGASVSLAYNYGNNGSDMLKAGVSVGIELGVGYAVGLGVGAIAVALSTPVWTLVAVSALTAVGIGYLLNTQAGKWVVDETTQAIKQAINSIQSKLQSFFSLFDSNPNAYELVSNPSLESKDYQALIELLLDKGSTAKDIDSLLHSFPNYLQNSQQNNIQPNATESTSSKTQLTKESSNSTPNNNNPKPTNSATAKTFPFSLLIKDYDRNKPLSNKQIQITNIDSKQTLSRTTNSNGEVSFDIKESEKGDFFSIKLINDNDYEQSPYCLAKESTRLQHTSHQTNSTQSTTNNSQQANPHITSTPKHTTQKILTPNSYANHMATLYFKAQISLYFNGTTLCIVQGRESLAHFNARSGKAMQEVAKL